ncbi:MAG TPA: cytochrome P450 [Sphingobium sp.]|uniref:cytochrome P450 n=1 Tax=Sphingobium sp. TaxID=1912891 RepID=UPI002ED3CF15
MSHAADAVAIAPRPDHIREELVYDFDLFNDPALKKDAHARILDIARNAPPVFWSPYNGGQWFLKSHAAVFKGQRAPEIFANAPAPIEQIKEMARQRGAEMLIPAPIAFDAPHHATFRQPIQSAFSPKAMNALKDDIRALAVELIEAMKPEGSCEFMSAVAEPLPVQVFLKLFGLPVERQREYRDLVTEHLANNSNLDAMATQGRLRKVADVMHDVIIARRDDPKDDLLSYLWKAEFNGEPATLSDIENYAVMLFLAGLDTVFNGMGLGVHHLATNPELQAKLRENPKLIPDAAEEILRRYTFTVPVRFVIQDVEFEGATMKKGERALIFLPAADLDPGEFESPESFDMARENKVHIAFGTGPHRCLGSHLARIELQVLYEEMLKRLPEFSLQPDKQITYHGGNVIGPDELPLIWQL